MARIILLMIALAAIALTASRAAAVTISTVPVGNPGNPTNQFGIGSVAYDYRIGTTEVTAGQYAAFLNAVASTDPYGLYNTSMGSFNLISRSGSSGSYSYSVSSSANYPIAFVSWGDSARFANWVNNGQTSGAEDATSTEQGAYTLNGATDVATLSSVPRNPGATWFLPSENEWFKAAYWDPVAGKYWLYPTRSDTKPTSDVPPGGINSANYGGSLFPLSGWFTNVGAFSGTTSAYGAFDMGGNVQEWNDQLFPGNSPGARGFRGGGWDNFFGAMQSSFSSPVNPTSEFEYVGFRMATVPEPSTAVLAALGAAGVVAWPWRRRKIRAA